MKYWLPDGISVFTRGMWLSTWMVTPTLFTSSYIVIGYLGKTQPFNSNDVPPLVLLMQYPTGLFVAVVLSFSYHVLQGNETKRSLVEALLEARRGWNLW